MKLVSAILSAASFVLALGSLSTNAENGSSYYNVSTGDLLTSNVSSDAIDIRRKSAVNATHNNFCAATLISPKHLLTGSACVSADIRYASIGSHYNNGTEDGEQIKVAAILVHPNNSENLDYSYDYTVLELKRPSSFKPIALTAADSSDIKVGETVTKLGWYNAGGAGQIAHELQRTDVQLISNKECAKQTTVDDTMMCSRPVGDQPSCTDDYGGPLIVERPEGDILVGSVSWDDDCKKAGYPSYYTRIPIACPDRNLHTTSFVG